jgi:glutathione S-transferase
VAWTLVILQSDMKSLRMSQLVVRPAPAFHATPTRDVRRTRVSVAKANVVTPVLTWDSVRSANRNRVLENYSIRPGKVPSSVPTSTLPTRPDSHKLSRKLVLFRDTNAWCPYCERVSPSLADGNWYEF